MYACSPQIILLVAFMPACNCLQAQQDHPGTLKHQLKTACALQVGLGITQGSACTPPPTPQPGMGVCDQFGADCRMWECPDYFEVDGAYAIKWSDQAHPLVIILSSGQY